LRRVLSEFQQAEYATAGVLFPVAALQPEETARFREAFLELARCLGGKPRVGQMQNLHLFHPWALELASHPRILNAVEDLIGPDILVHSTTLFCKYPGDGKFVSWHQDGFYYGLQRFDYTSAWIALTDSDSDNGCMRVVRGSHCAGMHPHAETAVSPGNMLASGMEVALEVDEREATDIVLAAGEVSFHDVAIVHGSNGNTSSRMRMGFAVRYVSPQERQMLDHIPTVLVRGEDRHRHYRLLLNPPEAGRSVNPIEAIRAQETVGKWILAARKNNGLIPFPPESGLRWAEPTE